ncbi:hypothetical protein LJB91_03125 [Bacteroidales bacterium OttesenSCG-928-L03]|nr:hypothetical protein [Bacteroidales bacterium OttesenSCG-928-L03]
MTACTNPSKEKSISPENIDRVINQLSEQNLSDRSLMEKGVRQVARLWQAEDGTEDEFVRFCTENFIPGPAEKEKTFLKISEYLEAIYGNYNAMSLSLQRNLHEATGPLSPIDELFAAYSPMSHFSDDLYANKIAFLIALNFPEQTLAEKETLTSRLDWAYARMGDLFTTRIPANLLQAYANANSDADVYISSYNIYAGHLLNRENKQVFPEDMVLLSHWSIRDEIKANYNQGAAGLDKQEMLYQVMRRIISQEIPKEVINSGDYEWEPFSDALSQGGKTVTGHPETNIRYQKFLNNFKALQAIDNYTGNTYIDRKFNEEMEIAVEDAKALFDAYLSAPELKGIAKIIQGRIGRELQAFDIWYDGFKPRSNMDEEKLSERLRILYPDAKAIEKDIPNILVKLGFNSERANYLADKIDVDAARGSGHAWGAQMRGQKAHLRTRVPENGTDYKGYNIAMHELGHNVEQTISLYDVDYYLLNGVPNTAFTEALAFIFQKRDLDVLGIENQDPERDTMDVLDKAWSLAEIAGVSMLDIAVWEWLYANPQATADQLKEATIRLSKEIWNKYFAPVFGVEDETVLAIYSHMVSYPLYLSAYAFGQIIEFQLEQYISNKDFATEVDRIYRLGTLTPNQWIIQATGEPLSVEPLLEAVSNVIMK